MKTIGLLALALAACVDELPADDADPNVVTGIHVGNEQGFSKGLVKNPYELSEGQVVNDQASVSLVRQPLEISKEQMESDQATGDMHLEKHQLLTGTQSTGKNLLHDYADQVTVGTVVLTEYGFDPVTDFDGYDPDSQYSAQLQSDFAQLCANIDTDAVEGVCGLLCKPNEFAARVLEGSEGCSDIQCQVGQTTSVSITVCP